MASMNDEVIYQAPGLKVYTEHGCLVADFSKRTGNKNSDHGTE